LVANRRLSDFPPAPLQFSPAPLVPIRDDEFLTEDGLSYLHLDEVRTRGQMIQDKRLSEQVVCL
jgi:hypothetical protein